MNHFLLIRIRIRWIDKKYLLERYLKDKECVKEVFDYNLIEIIIKEDYKECILLR